MPAREMSAAISHPHCKAQRLEANGAEMLIMEAPRGHLPRERWAQVALSDFKRVAVELIVEPLGGLLGHPKLRHLAIQDSRDKVCLLKREVLKLVDAGASAGATLDQSLDDRIAYVGLQQLFPQLQRRLARRAEEKLDARLHVCGDGSRAGRVGRRT